jgi:hypothetical protein
MRYYSIVITDPNSGAIVRPKSLASLNLPATWTSFVNGQTLPGAMNVEIDAYISAFATPTADTFVRIWGVSIEEIGQANDLRGKNIQVFGGMQKGLPLANPQQAGLLFEGFILRAYGNWIGTDQTLDLNVQAGTSPNGTGSIATPKNLVHNWTKGAQLSDSIKNTLTTAFPGYSVDVNISSKLVTTETDVGYYQTPAQYAQYIKDVSKSIVGGDYAGVDILLKQKAFSVYDGSTQKTPIQIDFKDLLGQPTWIGTQQIQFKTVMRADISVGDYVKLPPTQTTTTSQGAIPDGSSQRANSIFQGTFIVTGPVRHVGNFRQSDAASWNTTFDIASVGQ